VTKERYIKTFDTAVLAAMKTLEETLDEDHRGHPLRPHLSGQEKNQFQYGVRRSGRRIKDVHNDIWLVSFMNYDLGYFDLEIRVLEPLENPFGPKVLPMT
jgi:hypothetical protein